MKIEKGIPVPPKRGCKVSYREIAEAMEVGDSVLCDKHGSIYLAKVIRSMDGFKSVTRRDDDGKIRVWKLKEAS